MKTVLTELLNLVSSFTTVLELSHSVINDEKIERLVEGLMMA